MLAMKQNEHQHKDFFNFAEQLNADEIKIDKIQHNPNMDEDWLPANKELIYKTLSLRSRRRPCDGLLLLVDGARGLGRH